MLQSHRDRSATSTPVRSRAGSASGQDMFAPSSSTPVSTTAVKRKKDALSPIGTGENNDPKRLDGELGTKAATVETALVDDYEENSNDMDLSTSSIGNGTVINKPALGDMSETLLDPMDPNDLRIDPIDKYKESIRDFKRRYWPENLEREKKVRDASIERVAIILHKQDMKKGVEHDHEQTVKSLCLFNRKKPGCKEYTCPTSD